MPRANSVFCVGIVSAFVSEKRNSSGEVVQAALPIISIHGIRSYGEKHLTGDIHSSDIENKGYDTIWIMTKDPETIKQMQECLPYDVVQCKGVLRVISQYKKKVFCPDCGAKHAYYSTLTTIYPIYFERRERLSAKYGIKDFDESFTQEVQKPLRKEAHQYLKNRLEISNSVLLTGVISKEPELYCRESDGQLMLTFPVAVMRKFRIPDDDADVDVDFPFVKVYGGQAKEQDGLLHAKNVITIDGFLMTRNIARKVECEECGSQYKIEEQVCEVVPYDIEWIREDVSELNFITEKDENHLFKPQRIGSEADIDLKRMVDVGAEAADLQNVTIDPEVEAALAALKS